MALQWVVAKKAKGSVLRRAPDVIDFFLVISNYSLGIAWQFLFLIMNCRRVCGIMTNQAVKLASGKNTYIFEKRKHFQQTLIWVCSFFLLYKGEWLFSFPAAIVPNAGCGIPQKVQCSFKCNFIA